jgi:hypothetical protein
VIGAVLALLLTSSLISRTGPTICRVLVPPSTTSLISNAMNTMSPKENVRDVHIIPNDFSLGTGGNRVEPVRPVACPESEQQWQSFQLKIENVSKWVKLRVL